jgi:hypothetical protein
MDRSPPALKGPTPHSIHIRFRPEFLAMLLGHEYTHFLGTLTGDDECVWGARISHWEVIDADGESMAWLQFYADAPEDLLKTRRPVRMGSQIVAEVELAM